MTETEQTAYFDIRRLRANVGMTQDDVATALGRSQKMIMTYEAKGEMPKDLYDKFQQIIHVKRVGWLWENEDFIAHPQLAHGLDCLKEGRYIDVINACRLRLDAYKKSIKYTVYEAGFRDLLLSKTLLFYNPEHETPVLKQARLKEAKELLLSSQKLCIEQLGLNGSDFWFYLTKPTGKETQETLRHILLYCDIQSALFFFEFETLEKSNPKKAEEIYSNLNCMVHWADKMQRSDTSKKLLAGKTKLLLNRQSKWLWNMLNLAAPKFLNKEAYAEKCIKNLIHKDIMGGVSRFKLRADEDPIVRECSKEEWNKVQALFKNGWKPKEHDTKH